MEDAFDTDSDRNYVSGDCVVTDCKDSIIVAGKGHLVATVGLSEMVVATCKNATIVCPKERSEEVKDIVKELNERGLESFI